MRKEIEKCPKCQKEFEADSENYYWHLKIHSEKDYKPMCGIQENSHSLASNSFMCPFCCRWFTYGTPHTCVICQC